MSSHLPSKKILSQLTEAECNPKWLPVNGTLLQAVDVFRADVELRLLPILNGFGNPVGAVFDRDIRKVLLNPFGHALLRNPSIGGTLSEHIRPCPVMEITDDAAALVAHYRHCDGREGMILTSNGQLFATLTNRRLLMIAAEQEHHSAQVRVRRAERIEQAGAAFEHEAAALAKQMIDLANNVQRLAEATAERAGTAGTQASSVAAAASQTRDSLTSLTARGRGLAAAFEQIEVTVASNRSTATSTVARVAEGGERARNLLAAARSIDKVMTTVADIAGTVNLLSLNATIEAARAGDAGRGFAVVAGEIRKLSDQTQEATQSIAAEVRALQSGIDLVAGDYLEVENAIASMAEGAAEIDKAIMTEVNSTRLIAVSVAEAGEASIAIEESMSAIADSARSASSSARELDLMAGSLRGGASALGNSVSTFLEEVRAA